MQEDMPVHPVDDAPGIGDGSVVEIQPGIFWLRMPVSANLQSINVWALKDGDGWAIVDTGLRTPETAAAWRTALKENLPPARISRVFVTHLHPDHSGMAGWLVKRDRGELWMSRLEYYMLRTLAADTTEPPAIAIDFYRSAGWTEDDLDYYRARFGRFGSMLYPLPDRFHGIRPGEMLTIGDRRWKAIAGQGHSPEHILFYCEEARILISGDQVLPKISPNVSVYPQEPYADPLTDWLRTLDAIRNEVPDDVLVLPSHGPPFHGLHSRIASLIAGHENGLERLRALLTSPKRAIDVFSALFKREIDTRLLGLATGESLAHLACLRTRGQAISERDEKGVDWWSAR